jgi:hypothetical protein
LRFGHQVRPAYNKNSSDAIVPNFKRIFVNGPVSPGESGQIAFDKAQEQRCKRR